jgi:hypothetical protein
MQRVCIGFRGIPMEEIEEIRRVNAITSFIVLYTYICMGNNATREVYRKLLNYITLQISNKE